MRLQKAFCLIVHAKILNIGSLTHCCGDDDGGDGVFADLFGLVRMIAKA